LIAIIYKYSYVASFEQDIDKKLIVVSAAYQVNILLGLLDITH